MIAPFMHVQAIMLRKVRHARQRSGQGSHLQALAGVAQGEQSGVREPTHVIRHEAEQAGRPRGKAAHTRISYGRTVGDADSLQ